MKSQMKEKEEAFASPSRELQREKRAGARQNTRLSELISPWKQRKAAAGDEYDPAAQGEGTCLFDVPSSH